MIVVSDTSPLHYLILIDQDFLLPALFGRVLAAPAVVAELGRPEVPEKVRSWLAQPPAWLEIQAPSRVSSIVSRLGPGEAEAISLAREIGADLVLIDERQGARIARAEGLAVTGTLGVLQTGANRGLIALADVLAALSKTTFHRTPTLFEELLRQADHPEDSS